MVEGKQLATSSRRKNASNNVSVTEKQFTSVSRRKNASNSTTLRPSKKQKKDKEEEEEEEEDDDDLEITSDVPCLKTRMSPTKVVKLINILSPIQKESLLATPFKHFSELRVTKIPTALAHYIVQNYNDINRKLRLDSGETIDVSKEDVHRVLGLPNGGIVPKYLVEEMQPVLKEWIDQFGNDARGKLVKMSVLGKYIENHKQDGGPMFKRNILLFIISAVICSYENEHVYVDAFPWLVNLDKLDELDWCEFVHDKLLKTRENWSSKKQFRGPLLFLTLHFVDTVVDSRRDVDRTSHILIGWTTEDLNKRQKKGEKRGGFGCGFVEKNPLTVSSTPYQTIKKPEGESHEDHGNVMTVLLPDLKRAIEKLSDAYAEVDEKTRKLLAVMPNHEGLKRLIMDSRVTCNLSRLDDGDTTFIESEKRPSTDGSDNATIPHLSQDLFFESPSVLDLIDAQTRAKVLFQKLNEVEPPSFSLGLTQDFSTHILLDNDAKKMGEDEESGGEKMETRKEPEMMKVEMMRKVERMNQVEMMKKVEKTRKQVEKMKKVENTRKVERRMQVEGMCTIIFSIVLTAIKDKILQQNLRKLKTICVKYNYLVFHSL